MKKINVLTTALGLAAAALLSFIRFDDDVLKKAATQLAQWTTDQPQEKVYMHMDKPYYAIGDDIWFKAYVVVGPKHQLSAISGIVHVDLISEGDSIKKSVNLPITAGVAWGDFKLNDSLRAGNYRVRAYTNWMRNAGEEYFFDKTVTIGNAISNNVFTKTTYTYHTDNGKQNVSAVINYANLDGEPYTSNEVAYEVELNARQVARGKGLTDNDGNLTINFVNNMPTLLKSGHIKTIVKLSSTQKVTQVIPVKAASEKADIQFFPEGGTMVEGIRTRIAFKAVGADGLGIDVKGTVIDNDGQELAKLDTKHLGMGTFLILPQPGKTYTAKITYPDGSERKVDLPKAADHGYSLSVSNKDTVLVKIAANQTTFNEDQGKEINLMVHSGGQLIYTAKSKLEAPVFTARIPKSRFPSGIAQFTLFSATGEPLNERIAFIQNPDQLNIALTAEKQSYSPREKVKLNLVAKDNDGKPVVGTFSIAVTNETKVPVDESDESTIFSNLLLTSDIKGYIEKPNYYFTKMSDRTRADLDILMLTQGYRRFSWKKIMNDNYMPLAFKPERSLDISGHIKTPGGKIVPHAKVTIFTSAGGVFLLDTIADDRGEFAFRNLVFRDSVKFVVQARNEKGGKNVEIELDNTTPQIVTANKNAGDIEVNVNSTIMPYLQNSKTQYDDFLKYGMVNKTIMLKGVTISEKKAPLKHSDNLNGVGAADQVIKSDQLEDCPTLALCLLSRANFITIRNGMAYSTRSPNTPMLIVLDGMPMTNFTLDDITPTDVASVEVLRTSIYTALYGGQGTGGVLVITTKRGDDDRPYQAYAPGVIMYRPNGYYKAREFYAPQYDDPKTNAKVADLRTTIYWNPNILSSKTSVSSVSFFNSDGKGTYKAVIEGIDADGNIGRQVLRYKVE